VNNPFYELEVLWLAETEYGAGSRLEEHAHHEYYQIYYVMESAGTFLVNGEEHELSKDMFVFASPDTKHGIRELPQDVQSPLKILEAKFMVLSQEFQNELKQIPPVSCGTSEMGNLLRQAHLEGMNKSPYYARVVEHQMCTLLYQMIRRSMEHGILPNKTGLSNEKAMKIKDYLDSNYTENISLDDLAKNIGNTKNYLCRIFRESTGTTINLYLNNVRINKAVELLAGTDMDVARISGVVGYNNVFHFIKTFKKLVGISPGNYRRNELTGLRLASESVYCTSVIVRAGIVINRERPSWARINGEGQDRAPDLAERGTETTGL
jgi:AraC-like DNA-binding protein